MPPNGKHLLLLPKFHPEREFRLVQEFCKAGYTYDVVFPSNRIEYDWNALLTTGSYDTEIVRWNLATILGDRFARNLVSSKKPDITDEFREKLIIVDKKLNKIGSQLRINRFLNAYLELVEKEIDLSSYDVIIGEISSAFELALYDKARRLSRPFAYAISSPLTSGTMFFIDDSYQVRDLPFKLESIQERYVGDQDPKSETAPEILPDYMNFTSQMSAGSLVRQSRLQMSRTSRFIGLIKTYIKDRKYAADFVPTPGFYLRRLFRHSRFLALKTFGKFMWAKKLRANNYALFLQYEPEITTSLYAYPFKSQKEWIETILPFIEDGSYLYIKEHPSMFGNRDLSFYLYLKAQKKIRLIDPAMSSKSLIQMSRAVFTLNSTVGIESLKLGVPILSFGDAYYNIVKEVIKWSDLRIKSGWRFFGDLKFSDKEQLMICYAQLEKAFKDVEYKGCLNDHRLDAKVMSVENMKNIKESIERYVEEGRAR